MITRGVAGLALLLTLVACSGPDETPASTPSNTPTSAQMPAAKDGQNYKACDDGVCEVLIRTKAALNLKGDKFTATVVGGTLKLTDSKGYISLSRNGSGASRTGGGSTGGAAGGIAGVSWSDQGGPLHIATLAYAEGDTVIVNFTTK
ncbi:hypothetical protein [Kribbella sp. C-35]|uniref:hypothetical protein n=1 Tax=Kribbella sp. C-35 TaxID=2789276 RepID=UPI00397B9D79